MEIDRTELREILASPAFQEVVAMVRDSLTRKIMSHATTDDEVPGLRAEYRALERILATLTSTAAPGDEDDE